MMSILLRFIALSVGIWVTVRMPHYFNPYNPENRPGIAVAALGVVISGATVAWRRNRASRDVDGVISLFVVAMIADEFVALGITLILTPDYWFVALIALPFFAAPTVLPAIWFFVWILVPEKKWISKA